MQRSLFAFLSGSLISAACVFALYNTVLIDYTTVTYLPSGATYVGDRKDNLLHGNGRIEWPNGAIYEGEFVEGLIQGKGTYQGKDGDLYEGEFLNGLFHGQGVYTTKENERYEGAFVNDKFTGEGAFYYEDGDVYEGGFKNWAFEGAGKYTYADGETFIGTYEDGYLNGEGEHFSADGDYYKGGFKHGYYQGEGEYKAQDGSVYKGEFHDGYYHGEGDLKSANGDRYVGNFRYGDYHGEGTLTLGKPVDGIEVLTGKWEYGELSDCYNSCSIMSEHELAEQALYNQNQLLDEQIGQLRENDPEAIDMYFLGVAGYGSEAVFRREVLFVKNQFDDMFNTKGRSAVLVNDRSTVFDYPLATRTSLKRMLVAISENMNTEQDILFMFLTSHGSDKHKFSLDVPGFSLADISAEELASLVKPLPVKHKVIVVSSCYSGGHIPHLEDEHTLIITAADSDKTSFGCSDRNLFTYFGEAFFKDALPESNSFTVAFERAKELVTEREKSEDHKPSLPQISQPKAIVDQLKEWRQSLKERPAKVAS